MHLYKFGGPGKLELIGQAPRISSNDKHGRHGDANKSAIASAHGYFVVQQTDHNSTFGCFSTQPIRVMSPYLEFEHWT